MHGLVVLFARQEVRLRRAGVLTYHAARAVSRRQAALGRAGRAPVEQTYSHAAESTSAHKCTHARARTRARRAWAHARLANARTADARARARTQSQAEAITADAYAGMHARTQRHAHTHIAHTRRRTHTHAHSAHTQAHARRRTHAHTHIAHTRRRTHARAAVARPGGVSNRHQRTRRPRGVGALESGAAIVGSCGPHGRARKPATGPFLLNCMTS
jgi:hypothetical protein